MAQFNLKGRWIDSRPEYKFEMNIVMTGPDEYNMKAISAELRKDYWEAGYGEVFESGKVRATFCHPKHADVEVRGYVTANQREIHWNNNVIWKRKR